MFAVSINFRILSASASNIGLSGMQNVFAGPVMLVFWHHRASTCLRAWTFSNSVLAAQRAGTAVLASPCVQAAINVAAAGNVSALFRRILALAQLANLLRVHLSQFAVCLKKDESQHKFVFEFWVGS
jgi:hypothetical protein